MHYNEELQNVTQHTTLQNLTLTQNLPSVDPVLPSPLEEVDLSPLNSNVLPTTTPTTTTTKIARHPLDVDLPIVDHPHHCWTRLSRKKMRVNNHDRGQW
jgi:hypothetical protein